MSGGRVRRIRSLVLSVLLAVSAPAVVLAPVVAAGETNKKPAAKSSDDSAEKSDRYDPDNIIAISQYMETVVKGTERFSAKDYTAAIDTFKKAVQLGPKKALAHYMLAEAYLQQNNLGEAEAAIAQALEAHDTGKNPAMRSRVLFLAADIHERQKQWDKAKAAWQAYAEHNAKFADAGFPQTSVERLKVLQRIIELEKAYAGVRERIAAEKDAGKSPAKKP
jgi:tetratricopeptide (TPR) repeat protein